MCLFSRCAIVAHGIAVLLGTALLVGGDAQGTVRLNVTLPPRPPPSSTSPSAPGGDAAPSRAEDRAIVLTRVRLLVRNVVLRELEGERQGAVEMGPFVLDLPADRLVPCAVEPVLLGGVATSRYMAAKVVIAPPRGGASGPAFTELEALGASAIIDGVYEGRGFRLVGRFEAEQEAEAPLIVRHREDAALPFVLDTSRWFIDADGRPLDPTDAGLHDALVERICASFDADDEEASPTRGRCISRGG